VKYGAHLSLIDVLAPMLGRPLEQIRELALLIGSVEQSAERLAACAEAGPHQVFISPLHDELRQLEPFSTSVAPRVVHA
jgi:2-methylisocitrate lyase-like PEP mutase family enzyme